MNTSVDPRLQYLDTVVSALVGMCNVALSFNTFGVLSTYLYSVGHCMFYTATFCVCVRDLAAVAPGVRYT